jgi:hypothetical protein
MQSGRHGYEHGRVHVRDREHARRRGCASVSCRKSMKSCGKQGGEVDSYVDS